MNRLKAGVLVIVEHTISGIKSLKAVSWGLSHSKTILRWSVDVDCLWNLELSSETGSI